MFGALYDKDTGRVKGLVQKSDPSRVLKQTTFVGNLAYGPIASMPASAAAMTEEEIKKLIVVKIHDNGTLEVRRG